jgi:hypothetical protein
MSSKISGRHTRRQKKIKGGYYGDPYMQPTCTTFQWLMGQCPPQYSGQPPCTTFQWLMGRCPPQVPQGSLLQYGGNFSQQMTPPELVNANGEFKFFDPNSNMLKVFDPMTNIVRDFNPATDNIRFNAQHRPPIYMDNTNNIIKFYRLPGQNATPSLFNRTTRQIGDYNGIEHVFNQTSCQARSQMGPQMGNPQMGNPPMGPQMGNPVMGNPPMGPLMGNPPMGNPTTNPFSLGGKLKKHGIKGGKTKKGGKTHKNKK